MALEFIFLRGTFLTKTCFISTLLTEEQQTRTQKRTLESANHFGCCSRSTLLELET